MINKARKKFIIWAMIAMTVIVVVLVAAVNIVNWNLTDRNLSATVRELAEAKASEAPEFPKETTTHAETRQGQSTVNEAVVSTESKASRTLDEVTGEENVADSFRQATDQDVHDDSLQAGNGGQLQEGNSEYFREGSNESLQTGNVGQQSWTGSRTDDLMQNGTENFRQGFGKQGNGRSSALIQYGTRYFIVILDSAGQMLNFVHQNDIVSEEDAQALSLNATESGKKEGYLDGYKYLIYQEQNGNTLLCFLDCSTDIRALNSLLMISIIVGAVGIILGFIFILFMSGKTVEPVRLSIEKQKQFITNAGHELKTPLSAIATNMDILTMDYGENEWVEGTQKQVRKLRRLVENLVALSRLEEEDQDIMMQNFNISDIADECLSGFESIAKMQGKTLDADIEQGLTAKGDPGMIQQLLSILCDNALKYSSGPGPVEVRLKKEGRHVIFSTANPWEQDVDADRLDALFERFYRGDPARASEHKSAGHGLGLSIAKAMAVKNQAKLTVSTDERGWIRFQVVF